MPIQDKRKQRLLDLAARFDKKKLINKFDDKIDVATKDDDKIIRKPRNKEKTLLTTSRQLREDEEKRLAEDPEAYLKAIANEEKMLLSQMQETTTDPLKSAHERAQDISYSKRLQTGYTIPSAYSNCPEWMANAFRARLYIDVDGDDPPPPLPSFEDMKLPKTMLQYMKKKGIKQPSQIQMQGLPAALLGRDVIGIAFTGSGKTIVFTIPSVIRAIEMESKVPLGAGEGPISLIIAPSRELANQIHTNVKELSESLMFDKKERRTSYPELRNVLCMGGLATQEQNESFRRGCHVVVATPGRLIDVLKKGRMHLRQCVLLAMDEADRLVESEQGFEDEIRTVFDFFAHQRQTLLFSATMPRKITSFASGSLVDPLVINVGRAGAANLDVIQEVEYVQSGDKLKHMLVSLNKTPPPTLIFCENKKDVDDVHEYLLLKGMEAVSIHGSMSQSERTDAFTAFKEHRKDILIGTDVASKGLDFPAIQHVINFDMPREIESYVHRIGRTGRSGMTGLATTMINKNTEESILLDLKAILIESKQKIPPFLEAIDENRTSQKLIGGVRGCAFCGGLGHRIKQCPKLENQARTKQGSKNQDWLMEGSRYEQERGYGGDW